MGAKEISTVSTLTFAAATSLLVQLKHMSEDGNLQTLLDSDVLCAISSRGEAFTCLRQFLTYHAATITLAMILVLRS